MVAEHSPNRVRGAFLSLPEGEGLETGSFVPRQSFTRQNFFAWWKRHLKVYHLIARSEHGLMVQILAGLITYLLLAIYCHREFNERFSIKRVRQLRIKFKNELRAGVYEKPPDSNFKEQQFREVNART